MAIVLASKPGLSSTTTLNIPKDWDPTWFRNFINNQLKGADVRNAVGANGITVTGNISSPYATIGFAAPVTLPGQVTITAPTTAVPALVVNQNSTNAGINVVSPASGIAYEEFSPGGVTVGFVGSVGSSANQGIIGSAAGDMFIRTQGGNILFSTNSGANIGLIVTAANAGVLIPAPSSGFGLLMGTVNGNQIGLNATGSHFGVIANNGTQSWCLGHALTAATAVTPIITWTNNATNSIAFFNGAGVGQITGWGTPTGPAVVANFSGTAATLVQCSNAIAKIITDLKSLGLYAA